jgi:EpsI family protein
MRLYSVIFLLSLTLVVSTLADFRKPDALAAPLETIPPTLAGWTMHRTQALNESIARKLQPTSYLGRVYHKGDQDLSLFVAYYARQRAGETMHSPQSCLPGNGWEIWRRGSLQVSLNGSPVEVNRFYIRNAEQRRVVLYWYQSHSRVIASEYMGKLLLLRDAILDGSTAGAIVRLVLPDAPGAAEDAAGFARELIPQVQRCFGQ